MFDDKKSRELIVKDINKNYFVEASAGSGKTTSLVYRMVSLVESGVPVDKICTITFTKAAANEFFERFQSLLSIRSGDTPDRSDDQMGPRTKETKKLCQKALGDIDLCFLGTIDSFCNMIAHEMPSELKIPTSSSVISDDEYERFIKNEYYEILKSNTHKLHNLAVKFNNFISKPFEAFVKGVNVVSDVRNLKLDYDSSIAEQEFDGYFTNADKANILQLFKDLSSPNSADLFDLSTGAGLDRAKIKEELQRKYADLNSDINNWSDKAISLRYALASIKKMDSYIDQAEYTDVGPYLAPKQGKSALHLSDDTKQEIEFFLDKICNYQYSIYFHFVCSVLEEVNQKLKAKGKFQFFDFLIYLRNAFRDSALGDRVLVEHVFERHSYFMLDESQDTNPLQTELFFYLTGTTPNSDWTKMSPKEGSLFIVGDPKQSIYSFRGADVKAYLDNKKIFEGKDELLVLTRNYRSHKSLREWFNNSFNDMLNYTDAVKKEFALEHIDIPIDADDVSKIAPLDDPNILEGVYKIKVTSGTKKDLDTQEVAKLIIDIKNNKKIYKTEFNKKTGKFECNPHDIDFGDFLVVPRGTDMKNFIRDFAKYDIPLIIEGRMLFDTADSFNVTIKLLYLVKEPSNRSAFMEVMKSKLYRLNDADVIQMLNDGFELDVSSDSVDTIQFSNSKHQDILKHLNSLYLNTKDLAFSTTMEYILNDKDINIFDTCSIENLEYIYFLIEKIKEGEENGSISTLEQLKKYIASFISSGDEQRTIRFSDKVNRVKLANLHKVKGLQAPIVILAKPQYKKRELTRYIDYQSNPAIVKISQIENSDPNNSTPFVKTNAYESEKEKWAAYKKAEDDRLAYVGATRAESALVVCEKENGKEGYWDELTHRIDRSLTVPQVDEIPADVEDASLHEYKINEVSHKQSFEYISPSQSRHSPRTNKDEIDDAAFDKGDEGREAATMKGTIVHKLMECIISSKNSYDVDELIKSILSEFDYSKEYDEMLHNVASKILNGGCEQVNSSLDKDVLKTLLSAKKVWCEVPFSYQSNKGNIVSGIIDCMYLDDSGYHIIDYKTNEERDISVLEKHYKGQLTHYKLALKKMGVEADAHIYHIDL